MSIVTQLLVISTGSFLVSCILASLVDVRHLRIPDVFWLLPLAVAGFESMHAGALFFAYRGSAALVVFTALLGFRLLVKKRFGLGDVKFLAASTVATGVLGVFMVLFFASVSGVAYGLAFKRGNKKIPFAPFMAFGLLVDLIGYKGIVSSLGF